MLHRSIALVCMLALQAPTGALAGVLYLCSMDGHHRAEPCCPKSEGTGHEQAPYATLHGKPCCEKIVSELSKPPATLTKHSGLEFFAALPALLSPLPLPLVDEPAPLSPGHGDPPINGPPLFIELGSLIV